MSQFRVLYREFLFRLVDVELLSVHAQGDARRLLGQFASLLLFTGILLSLAGLGVPGPDKHPQARLVYEWTSMHFLLATTMLVVGLFAVLSWDAAFVDARDAFVLGPLPVPAHTILAAKAAAVGTALVFAVAVLHAAPALVWPIALLRPSVEYDCPAFTALPALPPADAATIEPILRRDLAGLARHPGAGITAGVSVRGDRRVFAFGAAQPDSLYEIGSVTKTVTAALLADAMFRGEVRFDQPVRELLPAGLARKPAATEITLADLATHRSGLPGMPPGYKPEDKANPFANFTQADLLAYIAKRGVRKFPGARFQYSNLGFGLLGDALSRRADMPYADLVASRITGPLGLRDMVIALDADQQRRFLQGYDWHHRPARPFDLDAIAGAGALRSSAGDLLTYLEAHLHPERVRPPELAAALRLVAVPRGPVSRDWRIGLAWLIDSETGQRMHGGATYAFTAYAAFDPARDIAVAVLSNTGPSLAISADVVGNLVTARLLGRPAPSIDSAPLPARSGGFLRWLGILAAYAAVMLLAGAFPFAVVLCLRGITESLLPRRAFVRASAWLQLAAFCGLIAGNVLIPAAVSGGTWISTRSGALAGSAPGYWFVALFEHLSGAPGFGDLAFRAALATAVAAGLAAAVWFRACTRALREIAETPEILPSSVSRVPLLRGPFTAFALRTLARSRRHRMILAFYLGVAGALMLYFLKTPVAENIAEQDPAAPAIASSVLLLGAWMLAVRIAFAMPFALGANWIFRTAPSLTASFVLQGRRRAMYALGLGPPLLVSVIAFGWAWPWAEAAAHLVILAALGSLLAELAAGAAPRIPFTYAYLPGRTNVHVTFWLVALLLVQLVNRAAAWERYVLDRPDLLALAAGGFLAIAAAVRIRANRAVADAAPEFDDEPAWALTTLDLRGGLH